MLEIGQLMRMEELTDGLVWFPMVGKLKGDDFPSTHLLRSVPMTDSGIEVKWWRDALVEVHTRAGRSEGPAICDEKGFLLSHSVVNSHLWDVLEELHDEDPTQFPLAARDQSAIRELIQINRSGRRSAESRAVSKGVAELDVLAVNRWSKDVKAKGRMSNQPLTISYTDPGLVSGCFKRFTQAM